jgi:hypothetical protein
MSVRFSLLDIYHYAIFSGDCEGNVSTPEPCIPGRLSL